MATENLWIPAVIAAASLVSLAMSLRAVKRRRIIDDTPTSKTTGVFIGMVELSGHACAEQPVTSYLANTECVHFAWSIEEHWERTVRETYTDSNGKTQTRTRTESGWTTIDSGGETIPFLLKDDHGEVLVHPEGADLHTLNIFSETCTPLDDLYFGKGPNSAIANSTHKRRFREEAIPHGSPVYLIGQARERADAVAAEIAASSDASMFVISVHGEEGVRSNFGWAFRGWFLLGGILAYIVQRTLPGTHSDSSPLIHAVAPLLYSALWCGGWSLTVFNSITSLRRRVEQAASNVDVMLKRRNDLIPQLINCVQGFSSHESSLHEQLAKIRRSAESSESTVPTLVAIAEAYPSMSSDSGFLSLQQELTNTETRIALARAYYSEIASFFNARTELVPDRWICKVLPNLQPFPLHA